MNTPIKRQQDGSNAASKRVEEHARSTESPVSDGIGGDNFRHFAAMHTAELTIFVSRDPIPQSPSSASDNEENES